MKMYANVHNSVRNLFGQGVPFCSLGPAGALIALSIGMVIMLIIGSNFSYLTQRIPITGGVYS